MSSQTWTMKEILETSSSYWRTCTLHTGVKLGIFTLLGDAQKDVSMICHELKGNERGVTALVNALCAMGLLVKEGDFYKNTPESLRFLSKDSPEYSGFIIMHHHHLMDSWNRMSESVESGKPCRKRASHAGETERESFLMGMFNLAVGMAPALAEALDLSEKTRLLDFGGGPGTFAIHFCKRNPQLLATVFDLPTTRTFAEKTIERFGLSNRIDFQEGSFTDRQISLRHSYDVAFLSHVIHAEGPEGAEQIIKHAVSALKPGGSLYIHEFILDNTMASPLFPALFSINMLVGTEKGQAYSEQQLISMMKKQGIRDISRLDYTGPSTSGILGGIKI
ncbi:MAG: methyltransferase [Proteobacteria bacterium]|nr:methyltransferase [Pseudomonadota bacterium]